MKLPYEPNQGILVAARPLLSTQDRQWLSRVTSSQGLSQQFPLGTLNWRFWRKTTGENLSSCQYHFEGGGAYRGRALIALLTQPLDNCWLSNFHNMAIPFSAHRVRAMRTMFPPRILCWFAKSWLCLERCRGAIGKGAFGSLYAKYLSTASSLLFFRADTDQNRDESPYATLLSARGMARKH